jgi:RHS repeat-associated protein
LGYDVENRITMATPTWTADVYSYGRENTAGVRGALAVERNKIRPAEKVSFYSVTEQKLGTFQLQLNTSSPGPPSLKFASAEMRVWFGSKLVTLNGASVTPDRLGSYGTYYPYGEDRGTGNPPADREKFATYTRDSVTGLDYAVNRYYNSVSGRFLLADRFGGTRIPEV